jgi:hypothetical protein
MTPSQLIMRGRNTEVAPACSTTHIVTASQRMS